MQTRRKGTHIQLHAIGSCISKHSLRNCNTPAIEHIARTQIRILISSRHLQKETLPIVYESVFIGNHYRKPVYAIGKIPQIKIKRNQIARIRMTMFIV